MKKLGKMVVHKGASYQNDRFFSPD